MADLKRIADRDGGRGQLILIGGLSLAVVLVVLALILNSAIFTENLATRGSGLSEERNAGGIRTNVEYSVRETIQTANQQASTYSGQDTFVDDQVVSISDGLERYAARDGRSISVEYSSGSYVEGTRVSRSSGTFQTYTVSNVDGVRSFNLQIERSSLASLSLSATPPTGALQIRFTDGTTTRDVYIFEENGDTFVSVYDGGGTRLGYCRGTGSGQAEVDITAATVDGDHCEALDFFYSLPTTFDIAFTPVSETGSYEYVVAKPESSVTTPVSDDPALYSATVSIRYDSPDVAYETDITVAPGDPDD